MADCRAEGLEEVAAALSFQRRIMNGHITFDRRRFKRVIRAILRSGKISIPKDQRQAVEDERRNGRASPYFGHCAQTTAAAWVLGKELYREQFDFKPFRSLDGSHYWLARPTEGRILAKERLDLTEHWSDNPGFPYDKRIVPGWITRKKNRRHLECFHDAKKIYDLAKEQLSEDAT
jgi:hypothetical protein